MNSAEIKNCPPAGDRPLAFWLKEIAYQMALRNERDELPGKFRLACSLLRSASQTLRPFEIKKSKGITAPVSSAAEHFLDAHWNTDEWGDRRP